MDCLMKFKKVLIKNKYLKEIKEDLKIDHKDWLSMLPQNSEKKFCIEKVVLHKKV